MRLAVTVSMFCCILSCPAAAQLTAAPEPTLLEVWARQPGLLISKSKEVGRVDSTDAQAVITALVIEAPQSNPSRVRGIRIDLRNAISTDRIYVEENQLVHLKYELDSMKCSVASMRRESGAAHRVFGIARCRPSQTVPQAYCPSYYVGPDSEGLSLSTFSGHNFRFPSKKPSAIADAIGRAMSDFGLDDEMPTPELIELPANEIDQIIASAVHHFPELASSPGIKAASYNSPDSKSAAWVVFWPYERVGDIAYSRSVDCEAIGDGNQGWKCDRGKPRSYLTIPDQESELVITGELDREKAIALIEFARLKLEDEPDFADMGDWRFSSIRPPDQALEAFLILWTHTYGAISLEIKEAPPHGEERFQLARISRGSRSACGNN